VPTSQPCAYPPSWYMYNRQSCNVGAEPDYSNRHIYNRSGKIHNDFVNSPVRAEVPTSQPCANPISCNVPIGHARAIPDYNNIRIYNPSGKIPNDLESDESDDSNDNYSKYGVYGDNDPIFVLPRMHPTARSVFILYHDLHLLVTKLKIEIEFASKHKDLPQDILEEILSSTLQKEKKQLIRLNIDDRNKLILEHNIFINAELRNRLTKLGIAYDESDNYVNVVNYARAKGLNLTDVFVIKNEILPWLGTNDQSQGLIWREKNDRTAQIIATNKRLNGGAKLKIKKSRHNNYVRKINKSSKKYNKSRTNFRYGGGRIETLSKLYQISYKADYDTEDSGGKIDAIEELNDFFKQMNSETKPEAKPHNLSINDFFDKELKKDLLTVRFDVKFDVLKTENQVKTWFNKYFLYVDDSLMCEPIVETLDGDH
jgi:hypothetical protein